MSKEKLEYINNLLSYAYAAYPIAVFDAMSLSKTWGYQNVKDSETILLFEGLITTDKFHKIKITEKGLKVYHEGGFQKYYSSKRESKWSKIAKSISSTEINNIVQIILGILALGGLLKSCFSAQEVKILQHKVDSLNVVNSSLKQQLIKQKKPMSEQKKQVLINKN